MVFVGATGGGDSTFAAQAGLVADTVRDLKNLANDSYETAQASLTALTNAHDTLPFSLVDVNIGDNASINWGAGITPKADPDEPNFDNQVPPATTIPGVNKPNTVSVSSKPDPSVDLSNTPADIGPASFSPVAQLGFLPEIDAVIPSISTTILDEDFSFSEPVYVERCSAEIEAGIKHVLSGNMGLPQAYWDSLWDEVAGDLARQQVGRLREARNRGAATYWGLPTETVLVASRAIQDETARSLQLDRLEKAKAQAVFAREDFWQAISQGIAYERMWVEAHHQMATRALAAAEQLVSLRVVMHNSNVQQYNLILEAARLDGVLDEMRVNRVLAAHKAALEANGVEVQQDAATVQRYRTRWDGYGINTNAQIAHLGERIKHWNGQVTADTQYEELKLSKSELDLRQYAEQISKIQTIAQATSAVLNARTNVANYNLEGQTAVFSTFDRKNAVELDRSKITQAAQETAAQLEIAQAQWLEGHARDLARDIAELSFGYAQAAVNAARVGLSSQVSNSFAEQWTKRIS